MRQVQNREVFDNSENRHFLDSLRKLIDLTLVDALLASQMAEDPFGPGVAPMAAVCISTKSVENFKMDHAL